MKVRFVKQRSMLAVGSSGPFTRVFEIGEVHDMPQLHANIFIAQGDAVKDDGVKAAEPAAEDEPVDVVKKPVKKAASRKPKK